jgi:Tol biopolymer transport system component
LRFLDRTEVTRVSGTERSMQPFFSPDGTRLGFLQDGKLKTVSVVGGDISTICDAPGLAGGASWGPGNTIVFSATWNGRESLFRVSSSGGEPELLLTPDTTPGGDDIHFQSPELLPDGRTVLFVRWAPSIGRALAALSLDDRRVTELPQQADRPRYVDPGYLVFFDGGFKVRPFDARRTRFTGPARPFVPGARSQVIWDRATAHVSRSGTAAFLSGPSPGRDLVLVDRAGSAGVLPIEPNFYGQPRFSPDGRRLVFTVEYPFSNAADLWIYDTDLGTSSRLTVDSASVSPEWSPDGRRVIYAREAGIPPEWNLYSIPTDNSGPPELLLARFNTQWQGLLTPDSRTLVFWEWAGRTSGDIWVTPVDTPQAARPLAITMGFESAIALSPDGRWLAYHSNESGRSEVYIRSMIGSGGRYQVSRGGIQPRWGAGGRELFFRNGDSLYVVAITPGEELGIGSARALFGGRYRYLGRSSGLAYDARPDGQRFVFVQDRPDDRRRIEVVLNWFDQLPHAR